MHELTPEGQQIVTDAAQRHRVSVDAVLTLLRALVVGHGTMAQFNHPELGGMGQWTQGGMTMVGSLFDHGLKARVDALCTELAALLRQQPSIMAATGSGTPAAERAGCEPVRGRSSLPVGDVVATGAGPTIVRRISGRPALRDLPGSAPACDRAERADHLLRHSGSPYCWSVPATGCGPISAVREPARSRSA